MEDSVKNFSIVFLMKIVCRSVNSKPYLQDVSVIMTKRLLTLCLPNLLTPLSAARKKPLLCFQKNRQFSIPR